MVTDINRQIAHSSLDSSLLIGESSIDSEHHKLISQLDALIDAPGPLIDSAVFSEVLSQLGQQIDAHFDNEEKILALFHMPVDEIRLHVQAHSDILEQYIQLNFDLMAGETLSRTGVIEMIKGWIIHHVTTYDFKIRDYIPRQDTAAARCLVPAK